MQFVICTEAAVACLLHHCLYVVMPLTNKFEAPAVAYCLYPVQLQLPRLRYSIVPCQPYHVTCCQLPGSPKQLHDVRY